MVHLDQIETGRPEFVLDMKSFLHDESFEPSVTFYLSDRLKLEVII